MWLCCSCFETDDVCRLITTFCIEPCFLPVLQKYVNSGSKHFGVRVCPTTGVRGRSALNSVVVIVLCIIRHSFIYSFTVRSIQLMLTAADAVSQHADRQRQWCRSHRIIGGT